MFENAFMKCGTWHLQNVLAKTSFCNLSCTMGKIPSTEGEALGLDAWFRLEVAIFFGEL